MNSAVLTQNILAKYTAKYNDKNEISDELENT